MRVCVCVCDEENYLYQSLFFSGIKLILTFNDYDGILSIIHAFFFQIPSLHESQNT